MAKDPLITRSELRRRREQQEAGAEQQLEQTRLSEAQLDSLHRQKEKQIDNFYRKENKKNKSLKKTRAGELQRSRDWNSFLTRAIIIVSLLIVIVMLLTFFL